VQSVSRKGVRREDCKDCCEIGASERGPKPWNTEADEATALGAVTRLQPVKTQQTEMI
jgi:hypothetical protein